MKFVSCFISLMVDSLPFIYPTPDYPRVGESLLKSGEFDY